MSSKNIHHGVLGYQGRVSFAFERLYLLENFYFNFFWTSSIPSGVNMEGAEIHGLSVGKKSSPKIDRDLREGKYLYTLLLDGGAEEDRTWPVLTQIKE